MEALSIIPAILERHCEEASFLWTHRRNLLRRADVALGDLEQVDQRIEAHLDGLRVAGEAAWPVATQGCERGERGALFVAATRAIESSRQGRLDSMTDFAVLHPERYGELVAALGWASPAGLRGLVASMLKSPSAMLRRAAIVACAMHGVDPGPALELAIRDADVALRARALRACGELGRVTLLPMCLEALRQEDAGCAFWAALSAVHLGDRKEAVEALPELAQAHGQQDSRAIRWSLLALPADEAHRWLAKLARRPIDGRLLIQAAGLVGDPKYAPWLIAKMEEPSSARLAAEAFVLLSGLDPVALRMDRLGSRDSPAGPNDRADDDDVAMDEDSSLPWPQPSAFAEWWAANDKRFRADVRHFMGAPPTPARCIEILRIGSQRQRVAAARHLSLLTPGTPLFNTVAPAWRQKRLLAGMPA